MKPLLLLLSAVVMSYSSQAQLRLSAISHSYPDANANYWTGDSLKYHYDGTQIKTSTETPRLLNGIFGTDTASWAANRVIRYSLNTDQQEFEPSYGFIFEYDNDNRVTRSYSTNWMSGYDTFSRTDYYYSNGHLDSIFVNYTDGPYFFPLHREYYSYSPFGLETTIKQDFDQSTWTFYNDRLLTNVYNGSGQVIESIEAPWDGTAFVPYTRTEYDYTGNNLDTITSLYYSGGWINSSRAVYHYDGNNDVVLIEEQGESGNVWTNFETITLQYDPNHNKTSEMYNNYSFVTNQWQYTFLRLYEYNSDNLVTLQNSLKWSQSAGAFMPIEDAWKKKYYYESPTDVSSAVRHNSSLRVYPNPASETINISMLTQQSQPFSITIYDGIGKAVKHWNEAPASMYQKQVDVSNLPPGNYFLRINNQPGEIVKFTIVK